MKLLSKTAWRMITKAIARAYPKYSQRTSGFGLEAMEVRTLMSVGLDPHFGTDGMALADFGGSDQGYAMAVQNDGKVLMAGRAWNVDQYDFGVVRFNTDGSLDSSFGNGGMVTTDLGSMFDAAYAMAIQTNGKIVVVGQTEGNGYDFGMVRYNSDGSLDGGFGNGGIVTTDFAGSYDIAYGVVVHASGKITVAGTATDQDFHFRYGLAQYNSNGTLDTNFGVNGQVMTTFTDRDTEAYTIMKGAGGSFVVGGYAYDFDSGTTDVSMAKYNSDGSLDTSFGTAGMVVANLGMDDETIRGLTMDGDGNIVAGGNGGGDFMVARFSSSGHLDSSFGSGGKVFVDFVGGYDVAHAVAMSGDKIMVSGMADMMGDSNIGVASLNSDGSTDTSFGSNGVLSLDLGSWDDEATAMVVESNGNLLVGGFKVNPNGDYDYVVAHYGTFADNNTNIAPVADAGGPYSVSEGGAVQLSGAASHDLDGSIVSYEWDLDYDGSNFNVDATGVTAMFSATSLDGPMSRMVALRVTDDKGASTVMSTMVNVTNANPVVSAGTDVNVNEGSSVDVSALVSDMGLSDTFTYLWHVSASNGQVIADGTGTHMSFVPADNGVYTVTVTVTDDDGGVGSDTMVVTALNVKPTANAGDDQTINEGGSIGMFGSFSDPGNDSYSILWHVVASNGQVIADGHAPGFGFTATDNGTYTVTYTVTDDDGGSGSDTMVVHVNNVAPTANAGVDQMVNEGSLVTLGGSFSDPGNDSYSITWHVVASNGQVIADGHGSTFSFTPNDNGTYTVTYTVTDDDGGAGSDVALVTVNNLAPLVNAGADQIVNEGSVVSLSGSFSDSGNDSHSMLWHVVASNGQIIADGHGTSFSFTPSDNGVYTVTYSVTDDDGGVGSDVAVVTVNNVAPHVYVGTTYTVNENTLITLNGAFSDPGSADTFTMNWHVVASNGQVVADGSGTNFSFTALDNGIYTVTYSVTDDDGGVGSDDAVYTVLNVAPTANAGADQTVNEGSLLSLTGSHADVGTLDTMSCLWHVVASNGQSVTDGHGDHFSFTPVDNGTYTVQFTVTDKDGASSMDTMLVTANNVAPTVNGGADKTVNEGSTVSLSAAGSDAGSLDTLSYLWHVVASNGQVIADKTGANFSFTALDNGTYTATVKVMDKDGGFSTDSVLVTVNNVAPVVSMSGDVALVPGQAGNYSGSFSDVGVLDTQQVMWNFGDGSVINWHSSKDASAMNVSHSWDKKGAYSVTMSVRDKDGAVSSTTQSVTVESKGQIKKDPNAGTVLVVGGSSVTTFLMPGTASSSTVLVAVDGKLQGVFNALDKIVAYDSNGTTRREITMGGSMAGEILSNLATTKLGAHKLARAFKK